MKRPGGSFSPQAQGWFITPAQMCQVAASDHVGSVSRCRFLSLLVQRKPFAIEYLLPIMAPVADTRDQIDANAGHMHQWPPPQPTSGPAETVAEPGPRARNPGGQRQSQSGRLTRRRGGSRLGFRDLYGEAERHEFLRVTSDRAFRLLAHPLLTMPRRRRSG